MAGEVFSPYFRTLDENEIMVLKKHERTGRPLGSQSLIIRLEKNLGRSLRRQLPGAKKVK